MGQIVFETEKEYQEFMGRLSGDFTPKRNKELQATRERLQVLKNKPLNIVEGGTVNDSKRID